MKNKILTIAVALSTVLLVSCDNNDNNTTEPDSGDNNNPTVAEGDTLWYYYMEDANRAILDLPFAQGPDGTIYFVAYGVDASTNAKIYALDANGHLKWKSEDLASQYATSNIVIGDDGRIFCASGTFLHALSPSDGSIIWTWECPQTINNTNAYLTLSGLALTNNNDLVVQTSGTLLGNVEAVFCISYNGELKWTVEQQNTRPNPLVIGKDGYIYDLAYDWDDNAYTWVGKIYAYNPDNGNIVWSYTGEVQADPTYPFFDNDGNLCVFLSDTIFKFNSTFEKMFALPVTDNYFFYCFTSDNNSNLFFHYGDGGLLVSPAGNMSTASFPSYGVIDNAGNHIGIKDLYNNQLVATDDNFEQIWQYEGRPALVRSTLLTDDGKLIFANNENTVFALKWNNGMLKAGWPRMSHDNRNTCNFNKW